MVGQGGDEVKVVVSVVVSKVEGGRGEGGWWKGWQRELQPRSVQCTRQ